MHRVGARQHSEGLRAPPAARHAPAPAPRHPPQHHWSNACPRGDAKPGWGRPGKCHQQGSAGAGSCGTGMGTGTRTGMGLCLAPARRYWADVTICSQWGWGAGCGPGRSRRARTPWPGTARPRDGQRRWGSRQRAEFRSVLSQEPHRVRETRSQGRPRDAVSLQQPARGGGGRGEGTERTRHRQGRGGSAHTGERGESGWRGGNRGSASPAMGCWPVAGQWRFGFVKGLCRA